MSCQHPELAAAIGAFVADAEMSEVTFGRKAMSDPHFVRDLKNGRRLWPTTEARVRDFMTRYAAERAEQSTGQNDEMSRQPVGCPA